jgi:hypothetical protein
LNGGGGLRRQPRGHRQRRLQLGEEAFDLLEVVDHGVKS